MPSFPLINIAAASTNEPWFNDPPQPFYRVQRFLNKFGKLPISYFVYGGLDNVTERKPHIFERVGREGQHRGIFGVLSLDKIEKKNQYLIIYCIIPYKDINNNGIEFLVFLIPQCYLSSDFYWYSTNIFSCFFNSTMNINIKDGLPGNKIVLNQFKTYVFGFWQNKIHNWHGKTDNTSI